MRSMPYARRPRVGHAPHAATLSEQNLRLIMTDPPPERKEPVAGPRGYFSFRTWWQVLQRRWCRRTCLLHLGQRR
jgi:hypothetical protein